MVIWLNANVEEDALYMKHQFVVDPPTICASLSICLCNAVNILFSLNADIS